MPTTNGATGKLAITKFLGITRCGVSLMSKSYIENIMAQLSTWTKLWVVQYLLCPSIVSNGLLAKFYLACSRFT